MLYQLSYASPNSTPRCEPPQRCLSLYHAGVPRPRLGGVCGAVLSCRLGAVSSSPFSAEFHHACVRVFPIVQAASKKSALRVAIVAENASFRFGGEASLPVHYFKRLRERGVEAWLVGHGRTRTELEELFPNDTERILSIPDRWYHRLLWRLGKPLPRRISSATFGTAMELVNQVLIRRMVLDLIRTQGVNVVHQPTPVSPKAPSSLYGLGVPVVLGPMNGGMNYPEAFRGEESGATRAAVALGRRAANAVNRLIPGKLQAAVVLVANERTRQALPAGVRGEVIELVENGVDLTLWAYAADEQTGPARFLFVGRLVDWKRLDVALRALARVPHAELEVIGDGPMRAGWEALAAELGIADQVRFLGWRSQVECAARLRDATALVLPSVLECGGAVVLEAMATGTPAIATDWGGPQDYITPACGFLVSPSNLETLVEGFADAMQRLAEDPGLRARMGRAGRARVEELFDWEKKVDRMLAIYAEALRDHARP